MDAQSLRSTIKTCRDLMRKDEGLSSDVERLPQFSWMLFLKCLSDHEIKREKKSKNYQRILPKDLRWENWTDKKNSLRPKSNLICKRQSYFPGTCKPKTAKFLPHKKSTLLQCSRDSQTELKALQFYEK